MIIQALRLHEPHQACRQTGYELASLQKPLHHGLTYQGAIRQSLIPTGQTAGIKGAGQHVVVKQRDKLRIIGRTMWA